MNLMINTSYNVSTSECVDIRWIGEQLKKFADALNYRYNSLSWMQNVGWRLRCIGDSFNDRNNAIVVILDAVELCLRLSE